ncbi:GNAT family N-acetyltransferase [Nitrosomonas sp. PY1]|uniref:GNAT family N-acetyltransferase n=1 Tax=Nitrosomonas sp. PY1 TaxID=1803906 RepID=UPI001FC80A02|nr:GNAT family N-acetyltransferase [Nitrosomonas sp. PY1]
MLFQKANASQAQEICDLVNLAYRGEQGWTNESSIIRGNRTTLQEIELTLMEPNTHFFAINQLQRLIACAHIRKHINAVAYLGFFSVHPNFQGQGLGKYILDRVEAFAADQMQVHKLVMFVVSQRPELIAFYRRRGYYPTGKIDLCPVNLGIPKVSGLTITYFEKKLT